MLENISATMDLEELKKQFEKLEKKSRRTELLLSVNRKVSGLTDLNTISVSYTHLTLPTN